MLCDVCQANPAKVYLTQIVEGKMQKVNLCEACSKEKGVTDPTGFALADLLLGLGTQTELEKPSSTTVVTSDTPQLKCPVCGFSQADFKKTQRMGCSECYTTFSESIAAPLKSNHKSLQHTGKVPARQFRKSELAKKMKSLQTDLTRAVKEEDYEGAAQIRDAIRKLEGKLTPAP